MSISKSTERPSIDALLATIRKLTVNPEHSYTVRDAATEVRRIATSDDAEAVVLTAVANHLTHYADSLDADRHVLESS